MQTSSNTNTNTPPQTITTVTQTKNTHTRTQKILAGLLFVSAEVDLNWEVLTKIIKYIYDSFLCH